MHETCYDSYHTTFGTYAAMLDYHQEQAVKSQWTRVPVRDLEVEPLSKTSPLYGVSGAFAAETSKEAVEDTAANLGLALRVNGQLYPVRDTAYKSLLDRAKIGGTALPKLSREVLAEVLNACLKLFGAEALVLVRDEKVTAVHSGDPSDYSVLPIDTLLETLQDKLDTRFTGNQFEGGYSDHALPARSGRCPIRRKIFWGPTPNCWTHRGTPHWRRNWYLVPIHDIGRRHGFGESLRHAGWCAVSHLYWGLRRSGSPGIGPKLKTLTQHWISSLLSLVTTLPS